VTSSERISDRFGPDVLRVLARASADVGEHDYTCISSMDIIAAAHIESPRIATVMRDRHIIIDRARYTCDCPPRRISLAIPYCPYLQVVLARSSGTLIELLLNILDSMPAMTAGISPGTANYLDDNPVEQLRKALSVMPRNPVADTTPPLTPPPQRITARMHAGRHF
jgi:hypothetical protein